MKLFFFFVNVLCLTLSIYPSVPPAGLIEINDQDICPPYVCSSSSDSGIKTGCATYSGSQIVMEECMSDWYCVWNDYSSIAREQYKFGTCTLKKTSLQFRKQVGEFCYQDSDCKSQYCIQNACSVKLQGVDCDSDEQCDKGLLCDPVNDVCTSWYQDGEVCKDHPTLCKPNSGCVSIGGANPVCTALFSINTSSVIKVYYSRFTSKEQYYCSSGSLSSSGGCAASSYKLLGGYPKTCSESKECQASEDASMYSDCVCWPNTAGVRYCMPFAGDITETYAGMKIQYQKDFSNCYNYDIVNGWNSCGAYDFNLDRSWAPQIKANTWGSCYDSVGLSIDHKISINTDSNSCPILKCTTQNNENGDCLKYVESSNIIYIQSCPENYICGNQKTGDYYFWSWNDNNVQCKYGLNRDGLAHKGEYCWSNSDCYSYHCDITKVCTAKQLNEACDYHSECDKGQKCFFTTIYKNSGTCQNWIELNGACTNENYDLCLPGMACVSNTLGATSGTCVSIFYGKAGEKLYFMTSQGASNNDISNKELYHALCESGSYDFTTSTCFNSSSKLNTYPQTCTQDSDCKNSNYQEGNSAYESCICLPNTQGLKYFSVTTANIDPSYFEDMRNFFRQDFSNCFSYEIYNNISSTCSPPERYHDIWASSIPSEYFPSCGKEVLFDENKFEDTEANDILNKQEFSSRISFIICIMLAILLFK